jgi:hypothetical protein
MLYTGVLDKLAAGDDSRVVALSRVPDFAERYQGKNSKLVLDEFPLRRTRTAADLVHTMLRRRFYRINETGSMKILSKGPISPRPHQAFLNGILCQPMPRSRTVYSWLQAIEERLRSDVVPEVQEIFGRYGPSLVVSTNPTTMQEYDFLWHAKQSGVTTLGIIKSWDVLGNKGYIPLQLDYYIVWTEHMKEHLIRLHHIAENRHITEDRIAVTGIPQFDLYSDRTSIPAREDFFSALNLEARKKTVLYATAGPVVNSEDPEILRNLVRALMDSRNTSVQVIARLHEQDNPSRYNGIEHPNLAYQVSDGHTGNTVDQEFTDPALMGSLRDTLFYCDVVVNTASTTSLDALAMGRPVVNIGFDLEPMEYYKSRRRYYDLDHYKPIVDSGTVKVARDFDEFVSMIWESLENPFSDDPQVQELLEKMCWKVDGRSAERMAGAVRDILNQGSLIH